MIKHFRKDVLIFDREQVHKMIEQFIRNNYGEDIPIGKREMIIHFNKGQVIDIDFNEVKVIVKDKETS